MRAHTHTHTQVEYKAGHDLGLDMHTGKFCYGGVRGSAVGLGGFRSVGLKLHMHAGDVAIPAPRMGV